MDGSSDLLSAPLRTEDTTMADGDEPPLAAGPREAAARRFEVLTGVLLAAWAAMLAASDVGGNNADNNCLLTANQAANAYAWYQSKSIKQDMTQSNSELLSTLTATGHYDAATAAALDKQIKGLQTKAARYKQEKDEILRGSDQVGQQNWVQDVDGKLGQVTGADEFQAQSDAYNHIGNTFDIGSLLLQVGLAIGALSLLFSVPAPRLCFFWGMNLFGLAGTYFCVLGYIAAWKVGMFS
jgi:hypothetical protein